MIVVCCIREKAKDTAPHRRAVESRDESALSHMPPVRTTLTGMPKV